MEHSPAKCTSQAGQQSMIEGRHNACHCIATAQLRQKRTKQRASQKPRAAGKQSVRDGSRPQDGGCSGFTASAMCAADLGATEYFVPHPCTDGVVQVAVIWVGGAAWRIVVAHSEIQGEPALLADEMTPQGALIMAEAVVVSCDGSSNGPALRTVVLHPLESPPAPAGASGEQQPPLAAGDSSQIALRED